MSKNRQMLSIGEAAGYLGISRDTLRRWEKKGKIKPLRSPTNRRYYTKDMLDQLISQKGKRQKPNKKTSKAINLMKLVISGILGFSLAVAITLFFLENIGNIMKLLFP